MAKQVTYTDLGLIEYKEAWDYQEEIHQEVFRRRESHKEPHSAGMLIVCEHPHVYTLGKSGQQNNLLIRDEFLKKINATYYRSNRGGDITYHGPGQLVGYPIFDLEILGLGVRKYIHLLEESIILTLRDFMLEAGRLEGATGVWLEPGTPTARKICAIGVRVSRAITMHGFALNVSTDLSYFSHINPCGFIDKGVTSIQKETAVTVDMEEVKEKVKTHFRNVFGIDIPA